MFRTLYIISLLIVTYPVSADINGRIVRVLDGDTVEILGEGNQLKRVRLAGIDAPEKNQPFGQREHEKPRGSHRMMPSTGVKITTIIS